MTDGQYKFSIGLDNKQLEMDIAQAKKAFDELVKQAQQAGAKMDNISNPFDNIGNNAPKVAEAARQFNGLNTATQQLVRELPAASMGLNTFFLAISNNLPIFADQVKAASQANKDLVAQGKPTTSVFKQIIGSLFSWQSALVLGVTALSMYGKEIGKWVKGLFTGKEALDAVAKAEKTLADVRRQGMLDAQKEVTQVKLAVKAMQDSNRSLDERKRAMRTLQDQYPEYFGKLEEEKLLYGEIGESVDALIERMVALATARKSVDKIVENEQKLTLLEDTKGYQDMMSAAQTFFQLGGYKYVMTNSVGQRVKIKEQRKHYDHPMTEEYRALLDAQETFLANLEEGGKEAEAIFEEISDKYDGNVGAYIMAIQESNKKLTDKASALITTPELSEDKAAAEEKKRKAEAELQAAELRAKQIANTSARLVADATKARTQAEIDAMAEGIEKKIAQINLDYDLEEKAITKREEELRKLRGGMITKQEEDAIAAMRSANKANRDRDINAANASESARIAAETKKSQEAWNEYLIQYGTFKEKQKAITDKYNAEIADAETDGERKALEAERDAILAEFAVEAEGFGKELADKTAEELSKMIEQLRAQVEAKQEAFDALDSSESVDAKQYQNEINELRAKIKLLEQAANKAKKEVSNKDWNESVQTFQEIARAANEAADGIAEFDEDLGDTLRSIAQLASAGLNLVTSIKAISDAAWTGAEAISAMEKASVILAAISATIQVVSALYQAFKGDGEIEETKKKFAELNAELEQFRKLAQIDSVEGTIFGEDAFGNFVNNLKVAQEALSDLQASQDAITNRVSFQTIFGKGYADYSDSISKMKVKTKDRNWLGELFNGGDEYANLGSIFPALFDESGNVTLEGLQDLRDSDVWEQLSKKDRELVTSLINDWEAYNKAVEASTAYLSDIFGDMGNELSDALLDAFENGTDAAIAFGDVVNNVMKRLASDIVNTTLFDPILKDAEDKALALNNQLKAGDITYDEYLAALKELTTDTTNQLLDLKDEAADTYEAAGIKQGSGSTQATSKGFQTMSQETGSELNGRFTDIQGQTHRIAEAVEFNKGMQQQQVFFLQSISETLAAIHTNTDSIEKHTQALARIDANIDSMRRTMDNGGGI